MPRAVHAWLLLVLSPVIVVPTPSHAEEAIRIEQGQVDVVLELPADKYPFSISANVRTTFQLRNASDKADDSRRVFPVAAPVGWELGNHTTHWCQVLVNDKPVDARTKSFVVDQPPSIKWPGHQRGHAWNGRADRWIDQDEILREMVRRYRKLAESYSDLTESTEQFTDRVKRYLIDKELDRKALSLATGDQDFRLLIEMMPEIDPELRIDRPYHRWKYLSMLGRKDSYRAYEKEWRTQADRWFASKPELAELIPGLLAARRATTEARQLIDGPIAKHLHDARGLSLTPTQQMKSYLASGSKYPAAHLVATLFPDAGQRIETEIVASTKLHSTWGFDESYMSPVTGKLTLLRHKHRWCPDGWRDQTALAELGRPVPDAMNQVRGFGQTGSTVPVLVSFDAPLNAGQSATVLFKYQIQLSILGPLHDSLLRQSGHSSMVAVFPSPENVKVTVTCPSKIHPVIAPSPVLITSPESGIRQFETRLDGDIKTLHLLPVEFDNHPDAWLSRFSFVDPRQEADLQTLIDETTNPTVRPLLISSLYWVKLRTKPGDAHTLAIQIADEHQDFVPILESIQAASHGAAKDAEKLYEAGAQKQPERSATEGRSVALPASPPAAQQPHADLRAAIVSSGRFGNPEDIAELEYRKGLPRWTSERVVSAIARHGGDPSLFPFVEEYYQEHVHGKEKANHRATARAFARIGDIRAIPLLQEMLEPAEHKRDIAAAIGRLQLPKAVDRLRYTENRFDVALRIIEDPSVDDRSKARAWQFVLADPDAAFERAMKVGSLHSRIHDSRSNWTANQMDQVAFIGRFGDVAAQGLLRESEGCSLEKRYCLAKLLGILLPASLAVIDADANSDSIDIDRKLTARLALKTERVHSSAAIGAR